MCNCGLPLALCGGADPVPARETEEEQVSEAFLERASDIALAKLKDVGGDPRRLDDPLRTVAIIYSAQGVIDNGGLRYFFQNDWPAQPPYSVFAEAYRTIGATPEADAIEAGASMFTFSNPERHAPQRQSFLDGANGERIDALDEKLVTDVWKLLVDYAQADSRAFDDKLS